MVNPERRQIEFELRADDGKRPRVEGTLIRYGERAAIGGGFSESFAAGALSWDAESICANVQHDRGRPLARLGHGLNLRDTATQLDASIELPDTADGRDVETLIRSGVLRGLSVEFLPTREDWEGDARTIRAAKLTGLAVVDDPAYGGSLVSMRAARMANAARVGRGGERWSLRLLI